MMKNPSVVFTAPRQVAIEDHDIPAVTDGKVLIETECTLVSIGTELTVLSGEVEPGTNWARSQSFPRTSGYCNVGTVMEVAGGADPALVGKRVQSYGSHAKFVVQPADLARPILRDIPSDHAVFATMAEIALNGVRRSRIELGSSVVVFGLGLLGQLTVRLARLCGARPVMAVDTAPARLALLPQDPGVIPMNPREGDLKARVKDATRGRMADIVIELTGVQSLIPQQLPLLHKQGTLAIVSGPRGKTEIDFHDLCVVPSLTILGVHNGSHPAVETPANPWTKNRDVEVFFDLVADGRLDMARLISHRRPYTDAPQIYADLLKDRTTAMGIVLDWSA